MAHYVQAASGECGTAWPRQADADAGALGQAIASRLFSAGMDLHFALMLAGDGVAAPKLRHAIGELDEALKGLRHLMLAITSTEYEMAKVPVPRTSRP
jgi:uncharacterized protein YgfB (UPF0149 family)